MRISYLLRLIPWALGALAAFWAAGCELTGGKKTNVLEINLGPELGTVFTLNRDVYDSIRVDFYSPDDRSAIRERVFVGKVDVKDNTLTFTVPDSPPNRVLIVISAYDEGKLVYKFEIRAPRQNLEYTIVFNGKDSATATTPRLDIQATSPLTLGAGSDPVTLQVDLILPVGASRAIDWNSSRPEAASIDDAGRLTANAVGSTLITAVSRADASLRDTLTVKVVEVPKNVTGISLSPLRDTLYVGGAFRRLTASLQPAGLSGAIEFLSSDMGVVSAGPDGRIHPVAAGKASVSASPVGYPALIASCSVFVVKDPPVLSVGESRKAKVGEEITFNIKVAQAYGGVAALKWDLDGDGKFDPDSVKDSSAAPRHTYAEGGREITVRFYARDTEGNESERTLKVAVGNTPPLVDITRPRARDTIVNTPSFVLEYSVDGVKKTRPLSLKEGRDTITVTESNEAGTGGDTAYITLDTKPPVVTIGAPLPNTLTNAATIAVAWKVDNIIQTTRLTENLAGRQGPITISRDAFDSAGNAGSVSVTIHRDTVPPAAPVFTNSTTVTPTGLSSPTWAWASGGGGRGMFRYSLDNGPAVDTAGTSFKPAAPLADGPHVLSVRELDSAGNISAPVSRTLEIRTNSKLASLAVSAGALLPTPFNPNTAAYSITVASGTATTTVTATPADPTAALTVNGSAATHGVATAAIPLAVGTTEIPVEVTALGGAKTAYVITVTRPLSADAALSALTAGPGNFSPVFSADNLSYTLDVSETTSKVTVTAAPRATGATLTLNGAVLAAGNASDPVDIPFGTTTLTVKVTSPNGAATRNYAIAVRRIDNIAPNAPALTSPASPSATSRPTWTIASGGGGGNGRFRVRFDNPAFTDTATIPAGPFTPATALADGNHKLYVQERDAAGNWSNSAISDILITEGPISFYVMNNQDYLDRGPNKNDIVSTDSGLINGTAPIPMGNKWSILFSIRFSISSKGQSDVLIIRTPDANITWSYPNCACPVNINAAVTAFVPLKGSNATVNVSTGGPSSSWMNIAVTYDGSQVKIYNGGSAGMTADLAGTMAGSLTRTRFGGATVYGNYRFFNRPLTPAEIAVFSKDPEFGF